MYCFCFRDRASLRSSGLPLTHDSPALPPEGWDYWGVTSIPELQLGSPTCCLPMHFHSVHFHLVPRSSVGVHWLQPGKPLIQGTRNKTQEGWLLSLEWQLGRWAGKAAGLLPLVHVVHRLGIYNRHPDQFGLLIIYLKSLSSPNRISFTPFFANLDVKNKWFLVQLDFNFCTSSSWTRQDTQGRLLDWTSFPFLASAFDKYLVFERCVWKDMFSMKPD